jgi:hypothetical protein
MDVATIHEGADSSREEAREHIVQVYAVEKLDKRRRGLRESQVLAIR